MLSLLNHSIHLYDLQSQLGVFLLLAKFWVSAAKPWGNPATYLWSYKVLEFLSWAPRIYSFLKWLIVQVILDLFASWSSFPQGPSLAVPNTKLVFFCDWPWRRSLSKLGRQQKVYLNLEHQLWENTRVCKFKDPHNSQCASVCHWERRIAIRRIAHTI